MKDAQVLLGARRYECAAYISGYVVELALKARICRTLRWEGYPETRAEFDGINAFRVHDLETLLSLTGRRAVIEERFGAEWAQIDGWSPELRYGGGEKPSSLTARGMVGAAMTLLEVL